MIFLMVFLGGGLGSLCRYFLAVWLKEWLALFPFATLLANALSCLLLGFLLGWHVKQPMPDQYRLFLFTGFCGGFSTFSTFSSETFFLFQQGQPERALLYVGASLISGLLLVYAGLRLA